MNQKYGELISSVGGWIKVRSGWIITFTLIIVTTLYILNPTGSPHISVPGSRLIFEFPSFREGVLTFSKPLNIRQYSISKVQNSGTGGDTQTPIAVKNISSNNITVLTIENSYYGQSQVKDSTQLYQVDINSTSSLSFEIVAVSIDGKAQDLESLYKQNLKSRGEYVRLKYVRKDLADAIFSWNDPVSNWFLTLMCFGIIWLIYGVGYMEVKAYLYSENRFTSHLLTLLSIQKIDDETQRQVAFDKYSAYWAKWDTWFRYFQALGPALGFIITVSSLVQALHPAVGAANDLDDFLKGIHVAMISTFLGLLLRIVALEGARVNDILLNRVDLLLTEAQPPLRPDRPQSPEEGAS